MLSDATLWYFLLMLILGLSIMMITSNIVLAIVPMVGMTAWLSIAGYIALWYAWVILFILALGIVVKYILPIVMAGGNGG